MPHRRSSYSVEKDQVLCLAYYDTLNRELVAQSHGMRLIFFCDGMVLRDSFGDGALQIREREVLGEELQGERL